MKGTNLQSSMSYIDDSHELAEVDDVVDIASPIK